MKKKKIFSLTMGLVFVLAATACGGTGSSTENENSASVSENAGVGETELHYRGSETERVTVEIGGVVPEKAGQCLGFGYDFAVQEKVEVMSVKSGSPIITYDFVEKQVENMSTEMLTDTNTQDINVCSNWTYDVTPTEVLYQHTYVYEMELSVPLYVCALPDTENGYAVYKENLQDFYVKSVTTMLTEEQTVESITAFFNMYGTHVIMAGEYGGNLSVKYDQSFCTDECKSIFSEPENASIMTSKNGVVGEIMPTYTELCNDVGMINEFRYLNTVAIGGEPFSPLSVSTFAEEFSLWLTGLQKEAVLIATTSEGKVPLWELLPSEYDTEVYKNKLKGMYEQYVAYVTETNA